MTARLCLLVLLAVTMIGCDAGGADAPALRPGASLGAVAAEAGDSLSVPVGSAFVYDGPGPLRYSATVEPAAVARVRMGDAGAPALLTITPLADGEARVTIRATAPDGRHADATLALTVTPPGIVVLRALADTTLRASRDTLRVDLRAVFAHRGGVPLAFGVENAPGAPAFARLEGASTLVVTGTGEGSSSVVVLASAGGRTARLRFTAGSTTNWCAEPEPGQTNFFPVRDGDVWRFAYTSDSTYFGFNARTTATSTWTLRDRGCAAGVRRFDVSETVAGQRTASTPGDTTVSPVARARSFALSFDATKIVIEGYPLTLTPSPPPVPFAASAEPTVRFSISGYFGFGSSATSGLTLSRTRGLEGLSASHRSERTASREGWSLTRTE